jgi:DNA invertase Pin-like site-specific DNA recombinase
VTSESKVVGYVRVSTDKQGERGAGLEAQAQAIREECERRGWQLARIERDVLSGKTMDRPGLKRALQACRSGEVAGIVVAKLDRLSRSVVEFGTLLREATSKHGWNIVALDLGIDLSTPNGKLVANVLMSVADWEREIIGLRTAEGLAVKKAEGVELGGPAIPQQVRTRMRRLRNKGYTYRAIAAKLNKDGVPTARGGKTWYPATVQAALGERGNGKKRGPRVAGAAAA